MKKIINLIFCLSIIFILSSCGKKEEVFTPVLDTTTDCKISIVGSYDNFEALELEFDEFEKLLNSNNNHLGDNNYFDIAIKWCIKNKIYDVEQVNDILYACDLELLTK